MVIVLIFVGKFEVLKMENGTIFAEVLLQRTLRIVFDTTRHIKNPPFFMSLPFY